jgi:hypothetical protein
VSQLPPSPGQVMGLGRNARGGELDEEQDDLPPPYSENPPLNPFYNEHSFDVSRGHHHQRSRPAQDHRRSDSSLAAGGAVRQLGGAPAAAGSSPSQLSVSMPGPFHSFSHSPLYPVRPDGSSYGQVPYCTIPFILLFLDNSCWKNVNNNVIGGSVADPSPDRIR